VDELETGSGANSQDQSARRRAIGNDPALREPRARINVRPRFGTLSFFSAHDARELRIARMVPTPNAKDDAVAVDALQVVMLARRMQTGHIAEPRSPWRRSLVREIALVLVVKLVLLLLGFWCLFGPDQRPDLSPADVLDHLSGSSVWVDDRLRQAIQTVHSP